MLPEVKGVIPELRGHRDGQGYLAALWTFQEHRDTSHREGSLVDLPHIVPLTFPFWFSRQHVFIVQNLIVVGSISPSLYPRDKLMICISSNHYNPYLIIQFCLKQNLSMGLIRHKYQVPNWESSCFDCGRGGSYSLGVEYKQNLPQEMKQEGTECVSLSLPYPTVSCTGLCHLSKHTSLLWLHHWGELVCPW